MASVNIGSQNQGDANYRYKMPKLIAKVEGRGNGIKTVIVNMVDIAKALHVDPAYPTKYFGIELGAQSKFVPATERAIVNGRHDQPDLAVLLDKFIQTFVLCPNCHLPELTMHVGKAIIKIDCAACGHNAPLGTNHKLTTYITKNPPSKVKSADKAAGAAPAKRKKNGDDGDDGDDAPPAAAAEPEEEKVVAPAEPSEVEWFTDVSDEAAKKRKEAEFQEMVKPEKARPTTEAAAALAAIKDLHKEPPEVVLRLFLSQGDREVNEITSELRRLQLARGLDDTQKLQVLLRAIINAEEAKKVPAQFRSRAKLLKQFAKDRPSALQLIGCLEEYIGVQEKGLLKLAPHIFKTLYEADVLDEDTLVAWYESPPESSWLIQRDVAVSIRKKAKPIIDWLRNAEEESDGDE